MVRGAGWDEIVFLLFGDVAFLGFGWLFLIWVAVHGRDTPPAPLKCPPKVGRVIHYPVMERVRYCTGLFPFNRDFILLWL